MLLLMNCCFVGNSQVREHFVKYGLDHFTEKVFIHTDRTFYLTGETVWFKLYCVNGSSHALSNASRVAYLEFITSDKQAAIQAKIEIKADGTGSGSIPLPTSLNSGNYIVRAYTNWMKNAGSEFFFQQPITIVNPFIRLAPPEKVTSQATYDAQFFPEGGNLVAGLKSTVAFRVVDSQGKGIKYQGILLNQANDTITQFRPTKNGIGRFEFTPQKGQTYRALVTSDSTQNKSFYDLPKVFDQGTVLHIKENGEQLNIGVTNSEQQTNKIVEVLVHTRQAIVLSERMTLKNNQGSIQIDKTKIPDGITHITLFSESQQPLCERLYFKAPTGKLDIKASASTYEQLTRKRIALDLTTTVTEKAASANLSVAVFKSDSLQLPGPNIISYLLLTSDLRGNIESPDYYTSGNSSEIREATDNLMLTHGWSRFKWEDMSESKNQPTHILEHGGHIIQGRVFDKSNKPAAGVTTYLASPGPYSRPYLSQSDAAGNIHFETPHFYGSNEVIIQTNPERDSTYHIEISEPFAAIESSLSIQGLSLNSKSGSRIEQRSILMQVQNIQNAKILKPKGIYGDTTLFYGTPDEHYRLDDYTRFTTMEEVMREYVKGVMVRKRRNTFQFSNLDMIHKNPFSGNPLILIDGVPVFDATRIIGFDPLRVKYIDVVKQRYLIGGAAFDGIVAYRTYKGDLGGFQPDIKGLITDYDGIELRQEFFSPKYETPQQRSSTLPDMRSLLFWSSDVQTDAKGSKRVEFYTSDNAGKYNVVIQGITPEGHPGFTTLTFEVKNDPAN